MRRRETVLVLPILATVAACGGGSGAADKAIESGTGDPSPTTKNAVQVENALEGTDAWTITKPANARQIEGYASAASVNTGDSIDVHVSCDEPTFRAEVFRLGWYGGKGGCLKARFLDVQGAKQGPGVIKNQDTMLLECDWPASFSIDTAGYCSGLYVVKLTTASGWQQYVSFLVRDDRRSSAILMQSASATYQAYNPWGGKSLYASSSSQDMPAKEVSFQRPHLSAFRSYGAGRTFLWDIKVLRFLEREGYDLRYEADIDSDGRTPAHAKCLLVVGHSEYWTHEMRMNIETALASGMHLFVLGGNTCHWQIRLRGSTIVGYKGVDDPVQDPASTSARFRNIGNSEAKLVGTSYNGVVGASVVSDLVIADAPAWMLEGTALRKGDKIAGVFGYEAEAMTRHTPSNAVAWAASPFTDSDTGASKVGHSVLFEAATSSKSLVVNTGCTNWAYGLDSTGYLPGAPVECEDVKQITRNVLRAMSASV